MTDSSEDIGTASIEDWDSFKKRKSEPPLSFEIDPLKSDLSAKQEYNKQSNIASCYSLNLNEREIDYLKSCDLTIKNKTNLEFLKEGKSKSFSRQVIYDSKINNQLIKVFVKIYNEELIYESIINNGLLVEELIYAYAIPYLLKYSSPHFVSFISRSTCRLESSEEKLKNLNLSQNQNEKIKEILQIDPENNFQLQNLFKYQSSQMKRTNINTIKNSNFDQNTQFNTNSSFRFVLTEGINTEEYLTFEKFSKTIRQDETDIILEAILFQLIWSLLCLHKLGINHNDLHFSNIFVKRLNSNEKKKIQYILDNQNFFEREDPVSIKIFDFDHGTWPSVLCNTIFVNRGEYSSFPEIQNERVGLQDFYKILFPFPSVYSKKQKLLDLCQYINLNISFESLDYFFTSPFLKNNQDEQKKAIQFFQDPTSVLNFFQNQLTERLQKYSILNPLSQKITSKWDVCSFISLFLRGFFESSLKKTNIDNQQNICQYRFPEIQNDTQFQSLLKSSQKEFQIRDPNGYKKFQQIHS